MSLDITILVLRLGMVALIFLFLAQVVQLMRRDLKKAAVQRAEQGGRLRVLESGASNLQEGEVLPLLGVNSIGRGPENSLPIMDDSISSDHVLLSQDNGLWKLEDLGSTNGTYVNGQRIIKSAFLAYTDVIYIGRTRLRLERAQLD